MPRALINYDELTLWRTFLTELGVKVEVSAETNRAVLNKGLRRAVDESCLPVKAFVGHLLTLGAAIDYLFVPRLVNRGPRNYYCPKFAGLPDIARSLAGEVAPVLEVTIDLHRNPRALTTTLERVARELGRPGCGLAAYKEGLAAQHNEIAHFPPRAASKEGAVVGVLGRSYCLMDSIVGYDVPTRLRRMGVGVVSEGGGDTEVAPPKLFWEADRRLYGQAAGWLSEKRINGLIHVMAFECGPDALFAELLAEICRKAALPLLSLVLDEHIEEAGLVTRLEAFVDLLMARYESERSPS